MKTFLRSSVMFLLGMAFAVCGFCSGAFDTVHRTVTETCRWVTDKACDLFDRMLAKLHTGRVLRAPSVLLVASKAFVLRMIRREAPRIENSWRLCPSC